MQMTRGSEDVKEEIDLERARSSTLITTGLEMIEEEWLSEDVSTLSLQERALVVFWMSLDRSRWMVALVSNG